MEIIIIIVFSRDKARTHVGIHFYLRKYHFLKCIKRNVKPFLTKKIIHPKTIRNTFFSKLCHFTKYLSYVIDIWSKICFVMVIVVLWMCVHVYDLWILEFSKFKWNKTIIPFFLSKCSICEIKERLSQNVDNLNVTLMSHRWCKMMKNRILTVYFCSFFPVQTIIIFVIFRLTIVNHIFA